MIRFAGLITGDRELVRFGEENGPKVLERAFQAESGSWASGIQAGGQLDLNKSWWIYCELDQFAATLALTYPETARYLPQTYDYWFANFVDRPRGEVWSNVDGSTHRQVENDMPKAWPWKNGYHSTEHAMVAFITTRQLQQGSVRLFYAFKETPARDQIHPYFFRASIDSLETLTDRKHGRCRQSPFPTSAEDCACPGELQRPVRAGTFLLLPALPASAGIPNLPADVCQYRQSNAQHHGPGGFETSEDGHRRAGSHVPVDAGVCCRREGAGQPDGSAPTRQARCKSKKILIVRGCICCCSAARWQTN